MQAVVRSSQEIREISSAHRREDQKNQGSYREAKGDSAEAYCRRLVFLDHLAAMRPEGLLEGSREAAMGVVEMFHLGSPVGQVEDKDDQRDGVGYRVDSIEDAGVAAHS